MYLKAVYYLAFIALLICVGYSAVMLFRRKNANINDLLGVIGFDSENFAIELDTGYFKAYEIFGFDIEHAEQKEKELFYNNFHQFLKLSFNFSLVFLNAPLEIENIEYKDGGLTLWQKMVLKIKQKKIETVKSTALNDRAYIYFNTTNKDDLMQGIEYVENYFSNAVQLKELSEKETVNLLFDLYNPYIRETVKNV